MTERYALIDDGIVVDIIMWNGEFELETTLTPVRSDDANIGWQHIDGEFILPVLPQIQPD